MRYKTASFEHGFQVRIPADAVAECSHQGNCDQDVAFWIKRVDFSHITDEQMRAELAEYGAWDDSQLQNREENMARLLWIACGDIREESGQ